MTWYIRIGIAGGGDAGTGAGGATLAGATVGITASAGATAGTTLLRGCAGVAGRPQAAAPSRSPAASNPPVSDRRIRMAAAYQCTTRIVQKSLESAVSSR